MTFDASILKQAIDEKRPQWLNPQIIYDDVLKFE